jgi:hypothetical protein
LVAPRPGEPQEKSMSIFIFAVLAGVGLHQMVSIIQPAGILSDSGQSQRIVKLGRRIVITIDQDAYFIWKAWMLTAAFLVFFGFTVLLIAQFAHPADGFPYRFADALRSSRMAAVVFGGLVGILLGNLLNRVLRSDDKYKFSATDSLQLALIFALVLLGIGGEEILRSSAQRINKISVGTTTEISFNDATPKSTRASAEQPRGAFQNTQGNSGGSAGLAKLYDIGSVGYGPHINRDKELIGVLVRYERKPVPKFDDVGRVSFDVLSPVASCLSRIGWLYGDEAFAEHQLVRVDEALREVIAPGPKSNEEIRKKLTAAALEVGQYENGWKKEFEAAAAKLNADSDDRTSCARLTDADYKPDAALTDSSIDSFRRSHLKLPYVAMSYASVMAALHRYEAATITMDNWILARKDQARKTPASEADRWFLLRAQTTQALFVEEWIRYRGAAAPSQLRKYQIDNLKDIMDGMSSFSAISGITRTNSSYAWSFGLFGATASGDEGPCKIPPLPAAAAPTDGQKTPDGQKTTTPIEDALEQVNATRDLKVIYNTYLSARKDYVDNSLKHPIQKIKWAKLIDDEIASVMRLSLDCISFQLPDQRRTRAEHIERYVRSELNMLENTAPLKSSDEIRDKVREARQLLTLASQLVAQQVDDAKKNVDAGPIQHRIAIDPVLELYESLLATQAQLQSLSEREIAN